ncbi:UNVERIFIED_CONTAM: hypothetical protein HDU68_012274 [Siphonaria sp. JEL0065]|nr:hypothetical protein HDU68_012274 [Siphonaria sp. JEL0065]
MASITHEIEQNFQVADLIVKSNAVSEEVSLQHCTLGALKSSHPVMLGELLKLQKSAKVTSPDDSPTPEPQPTSRYKERYFVLTNDGKLFLFKPNASDIETPLSYLILITSTNNADVTNSPDPSVLKVWGNNIHPETGALQKHSWILKSDSEDTCMDWIDGINRVASCAQEELLVKLERRFSTSRSGRGSRLSVEQAALHRRSVSLMSKPKKQRPVTSLEAPMMSRDAASAQMLYYRAKGAAFSAQAVVPETGVLPDTPLKENPQLSQSSGQAPAPITPAMLLLSNKQPKPSRKLGYLKTASQKKNEWFKWLTKPSS